MWLITLHHAIRGLMEVVGVVGGVADGLCEEQVGGLKCAVDSQSMGNIVAEGSISEAL